MVIEYVHLVDTIQSDYRQKTQKPDIFELNCGASENRLCWVFQLIRSHCLKHEL